MNLPITGLRKVCTPAILYLCLSSFAIFFMLFQLLNNSTGYCIGDNMCDKPTIALIFIVKIIYVLFWTWLLNIICKSGYGAVSWFLVLLPFILFFILVSLVIIIP